MSPRLQVAVAELKSSQIGKRPTGLLARTDTFDTRIVEWENRALLDVTLS